jgi:hypothetical protein
MMPSSTPEDRMERGHYLETSNTAYFRHDYEHADMRRLYEQAKIDQWNAATDIDWEKPLDGDGGLIADLSISTARRSGTGCRPCNGSRSTGSSHAGASRH